MADIERAIRINPKEHYYYFSRGKLCKAKGMNEKDIVDYRHACGNGEKEAREAIKKLTGVE